MSTSPIQVLPHNRNAAGRFPAGRSGNPGGRPKSSLVRRELLKAAKIEIAPGVTQLACMAQGMMDKAASDVAAASFVRDTIDGKPQSDGSSNGTQISIAIAVESIGNE